MTDPDRLFRHPLVGPLESFHQGQQIVRIGLKNGTHLVGVIMDVDDKVVTVARLKSLSPKYTLHDDYDIILDEIIAVGIDHKHYKRPSIE